MTLTAMTAAANAYCDENYATSLTMSYANEAIAQANAELDAVLPFFTSATSDYIALSETWLRGLIIPYICWSIKMNDGSLSEADRYQTTYARAFEKLKLIKDNVIPVAYQGTNFSGVYEIDYGRVSLYGQYDAHEYATRSAFPAVGIYNEVYKALDTNLLYRWDSVAYILI